MKKKYDFGIICALTKEIAALDLIFDSTLVKGSYKFAYTEGIVKTNQGYYKCIFANSGKSEIKANILVLDMINTFDVKQIIFTGIAGGVPNPLKGSDHVRLGDIVVAESVHKLYRGVAKNDNTISHKNDPTKLPSKILLQRADYLIRKFTAKEQPWEEFINKAIILNKSFARPDKNLYKDVFKDGENILHEVHPVNDDRIEDKPLPRIGVIGSSPMLIKDARVRSKFADDYDLKAIEMESGGIADGAESVNCEYLVIQGICDYADDLKNDVWQKYAALVSAAFAKALILTVPHKPTYRPKNLLQNKIQKETIEPIIIEESINGKVLYSENQYQLNCETYYKDSYSKLSSENNNLLLESEFFYNRVQYNNVLDYELKIRGLAILCGPQLIGKSYLIKNYAEKIKCCDYIDSVSLANRILGSLTFINKNTLDILDVYSTWGQYIIGKLANKKGLDEEKLSAELSALLSNSNAFKQELIRLKNLGKSDSNLENLLAIIERYLFQLGYDGSTILAIHLEDLQDYLDDKLFRLLINDIKPIFFLKIDKGSTFKSLQKIKLVISSRYFPAFPNNTILVGNLNKSEIKDMLGKIEEKWNGELIDFITDTVYKATSGHVWFLIRFIRLYMKHRVNLNYLHPLILTSKIIESSEFWCSEKYFGTEEILSEYLLSCNKIKLALKYNEEYDFVINKVQEFMNIKTYSDLLINSEEYKNNPFLIQTGLLMPKVNDRLRDLGVVEFKNDIIRKYYIPLLKQQIL